MFFQCSGSVSSTFFCIFHFGRGAICLVCFSLSVHAYVVFMAMWQYQFHTQRAKEWETAQTKEFHLHPLNAFFRYWITPAHCCVMRTWWEHSDGFPNCYESSSRLCVLLLVAFSRQQAIRYAGLGLNKADWNFNFSFFTHFRWNVLQVSCVVSTHLELSHIFNDTFLTYFFFIRKRSILM